MPRDALGQARAGFPVFLSSRVNLSAHNPPDTRISILHQGGGMRGGGGGNGGGGNGGGNEEREMRKRELGRGALGRLSGLCAPKCPPFPPLPL